MRRELQTFGISRSGCDRHPTIRLRDRYSTDTLARPSTGQCIPSLTGALGPIIKVSKMHRRSDVVRIEKCEID